MLRKIADYSTQILIKQGMILEKDRNIYLYGFELFWSTSSCIIFIIIAGYIMGYIQQAIIFIMCFFPIRTFAGGYHAKSYRNCFLLTNFIAFAAIVSSDICQTVCLSKKCIVIMYTIASLYIWSCAPVVFKEHPVKKDLLEKNRLYAHILLILGAISMICLCFYESNAIYVMTITTCIVAFMMFISIKKEETI